MMLDGAYHAGLPLRPSHAHATQAYGAGAAAMQLGEARASAAERSHEMVPHGAADGSLGAWASAGAVALW